MARAARVVVTRRVIQFATGNVGIHCLRSVIERPDYELVGLHASGADKVGRDAGDIAGLGVATGVVATDDIDELVALRADCVIYTSRAETRPHEAIADLVRFLASGTNVVASSLVWLVAPDFADDWLIGPLHAACTRGRSTLYVNGVDPGFSGDILAYTALSLSSRASTVTVQEIFDYAGYDDPEFTGAAFGLGEPPDSPAALFAPGVVELMWGAQIRSLAADLGVELDGITERHERWVTAEPIDCTMMHVAPGAVARCDSRQSAPVPARR